MVLEEIAEILAAYPRAAIVGGTVPYLLVPQKIEAHEGTVDIDIVLDRQQPGADDVYTLHEILERRLFVQDPKRPFRYRKGVEANGEHHDALVELLAGGTPPPSGMVRITTEDIFVSIIPGMEVALDNPIVVQLPGMLNRSLAVASLPAFFAMKACALSRRDTLQKQKDAYDIVYCLRNYPGGIKSIAQEIVRAMTNPIVASGVNLLRTLFASPDSEGPIAYAMDADDDYERALKKREAFERVTDLYVRIEEIS